MEEYDIKKCPIHSLEYTGYCITCKTLVCKKCKEHMEHKIKHLSEYIKKYPFP